METGQTRRSNMSRSELVNSELPFHQFPTHNTAGALQLGTDADDTFRFWFKTDYVTVRDFTCSKHTLLDLVDQLASRGFTIKSKLGGRIVEAWFEPVTA